MRQDWRVADLALNCIRSLSAIHDSHERVANWHTHYLFLLPMNSSWMLERCTHLATLAYCTKICDPFAITTNGITDRVDK